MKIILKIIPSDSTASVKDLQELINKLQKDGYTVSFDLASWTLTLTKD